MSSPRSDDRDFTRLGDLLQGADSPPSPRDTGRALEADGEREEGPFRETTPSRSSRDGAPSRPADGGARGPGSGRCAGVKGAGRPLSDDLGRRLAFLWLEVVGEEIAANAQPLRLKEGRLVVSASSSAWAQTLQFMSEDIRVCLNERLGGETIELIAFRHAGWEGRAGVPSRATAEDHATAGASVPAPGPPTGPTPDLGAIATAPTSDLTDEQQAVLEGVRSLGLSPELSVALLRAMRAAFVREERSGGR